MVLTCILGLTIYAGEGRHVELMTPEKVVAYKKIEFATSLAYPPAVNLPRLGMLCLYLRIFPRTSRYRYAAHFIIGLVVLSWVVIQLVQLTWCIPVRYFWDKSIPGGHCIDTVQFENWASFPNLVTDVAIFILPIPVVWNLQMSVKQKIGVSLTFATGCMYVGEYLV